jgi:hypothetical protein
MAPAQDPLAIAAQTILQAPYVENGIVYIKLSRWFGNIVGDIERIERESTTKISRGEGN